MRAFIVVLILLVVTGAAMAQTPSKVTPRSYGGELIAESSSITRPPSVEPTNFGSLIESVDPVRSGYDGLAGKFYNWKAVTQHCFGKNVFGTKLFGMKIRYHWSWWVVPGTDTIKNWWRETVVPSDLKYGWDYDGSFQGPTSGGKGHSYLKNSITSKFHNVVYFGAAALIVGDITLYADGGAVPDCHQG